MGYSGEERASKQHMERSNQPTGIVPFCLIIAMGGKYSLEADRWALSREVRSNGTWTTSSIQVLHLRLRNGELVEQTWPGDTTWTPVKALH